MFGRRGDEDREQLVQDSAREFSVRLRDRASEELPLLPFGGVQQAQALIDAKNARWVSKGQGLPSQQQLSRGTRGSISNK